ncbi:AI-2E family transporter [Halosimplex rubrum]|uniref:AI-2E family transporter n=1 Tax=Halosimplex rubrum TaxID=869889 RepID=UPI001FEAC4B0|nr:AI-2E family transporter [Halosimplex rubrum]
MALTRRQQVLGGLFVGMAALTLVILSRVVGTVFFAITVAYVLYPVRRMIVGRGVNRRIAAATATAVGFLFVALIVGPIVYALYGRQALLLEFLRSIPAEQPISVFGMSFVIDVSALIVRARAAVVDIGFDIAGAAPVLALKAFLFVFLVYGLLLRPGNVRRATLRLVPGEYHDVVLALHRCVRDTLYALYVLQAATALGTFAVAYVVFSLLGYDSAFTLSVFSGLLQFIPVLGPSLLIAAVAVGQALAGEVTAALLVASTGLVLIGFLPDALIRPRLASLTTGMSASLYFVGFTGGTLSLGVVGVIAGPLVVALLVEVVELITDERTTVQQTFDGAAIEPDGPPSDPPGSRAADALAGPEPGGADGSSGDIADGTAGDSSGGPADDD